MKKYVWLPAMAALIFGIVSCKSKDEGPQYEGVGVYTFIYSGYIENADGTRFYPAEGTGFPDLEGYGIPYSSTVLMQFAYNKNSAYTQGGPGKNVPIDLITIREITYRTQDPVFSGSTYSDPIIALHRGYGANPQGSMLCNYLNFRADVFFFDWNAEMGTPYSKFEFDLDLDEEVSEGDVIHARLTFFANRGSSEPIQTGKRSDPWIAFDFHDVIDRLGLDLTKTYTVQVHYTAYDWSGSGPVDESKTKDLSMSIPWTPGSPYTR